MHTHTHVHSQIFIHILTIYHLVSIFFSVKNSNIFCSVGLLAGSSHLPENAFIFPSSLKDAGFGVDRLFVLFLFFNATFKDVISLSLDRCCFR